MKRLGKRKVGFISLLVASALSAVSVNIHHDWNLITTAGVDNVSSDCILNQVDGSALIWTFENGHWKAASNDQYMKNLISSSNFHYVTNISKEQGFWLLNPGGDKPINMECNENGGGDNNATNHNNPKIPQFTYGSDVTVTTSDILTVGNQFVEPDNDGYGIFEVQSETEIYMTWYEVDGNETKVEDNMTINVATQSDNNMTYTLSGGESPGEQGYVIFNGAREVTQIGDTNVTGVTEYNLTRVVTQEGTPVWKESDWQPTRWVDGHEENITDIVTFKNIHIKPDEVRWHGWADHKWAFAEESNTSVTSGNLVRVEWDGHSYQENCDGHDCKIYTRTTDIVGTWTLEDGVLSADTATRHIAWKFVDGKLYRQENDKAGAVENMKWYGTTGDINSLIQIYKNEMEH